MTSAITLTLTPQILTLGVVGLIALIMIGVSVARLWPSLKTSSRLAARDPALMFVTIVLTIIIGILVIILTNHH